MEKNKENRREVTMNLCSCGCEQECNNKYIRGHNIKVDNPNNIPEVIEKIRRKLVGRTAETHESIRIAAEKRTGRTKENDESVRRMSETKTGRTKENDEKVKKMAETKTGRTKKSHEYIRRAAEKHSKWMLNGGSAHLRKFIKRYSKEELKLRGIVKDLYPTSEHTYKVLENRGYEVDNALVENKIAIEYDGYYHFDTEEHKEYHKRRQKEIEEDGWVFLRYNIFQPFPSKEQLMENINVLQFLQK